MNTDAYTLGDPHRGYVEGCARRQLVFSRCDDCQAAQLAAHRTCRRCGSQALRDEVSAGAGTVATYTIVHKAASPRFKPMVPFALALIDFDEGFRALMRVAGTLEPAIGDRVRVDFAGDGIDGGMLPYALRVEGSP